jgi:hypothetical protein
MKPAPVCTTSSNGERSFITDKATIHVGLTLLADMGSTIHGDFLLKKGAKNRL